MPKSSAASGLRVGLAFPNSYYVAMSNLGFQTVYAAFAACPDVSVERFLLPEKGGRELRSHESGKPVSSFDLLAFSISIESDYLNLLSMLRMGGCLEESAARRAEIADTAAFAPPLILVGGTAPTLNAEPIADFLDMVFVGEADEAIPEIATALQESRRSGLSRSDTLEQLSKIEGIYVPALFKPHYAGDGKIAGFETAAAKPVRRYVKNLDAHPASTAILTAETEFSSMFLTETGRGCEMGCRFCISGYAYRPVRKRGADSIKASIDEGLKYSRQVGLVGAAVSSHRSINELIQHVQQAGGRASLSSLMSQKISKELAACLCENESRSVALAPETGSEKLRFAVGKRVRDEQIGEAIRLLAEAGIARYKLYFMLGLPSETLQDAEAIATLVENLHSVVRSQNPKLRPEFILTLNAFVPKPWTPFQWEGMCAPELIEERLALVSAGVRKVRGVKLRAESVRESIWQTLLSRGDRRLGRLLKYMLDEEIAPGRLARRMSQTVLSGVPPVDFYVARRFDFDEILPWEVIDGRIEKSLLRREAERAFSGD